MKKPAQKDLSWGNWAIQKEIVSATNLKAKKNNPFQTQQKRAVYCGSQVCHGLADIYPTPVELIAKPGFFFV